MKKQSENSPYNKFLQPPGAPVSRHYNQATESTMVPASTQYPKEARPRFGANSFDLAVQRDAIKTLHIKNFSFNSGTGGTIQLGGTLNGNGLEVVKNASGTTIVQIDNTGIAVNYGSITLNNASNSLMMDASGIRSTANFTQSAAIAGINLAQHITGSSDQDITGATFSVTVSRSTFIVITANVTNYTYYVGVDGLILGKIRIEIDGVIQATSYEEGGVITGVTFNNGNNINITTPIQAAVSLSPGAHTVKLTAAESLLLGTDTDFVINAFYFSYFLLGT